MRSITLPELFDRTRQALLARAEGVFCFRKWVLPNADKFFIDGAHRLMAFARLSDLLPLGPVSETLGDSVFAERCLQDELCRDADQALEGNFSLLGFERLEFGYPINWHLDPINGRKIPLVPWKRLDSLDPSVTGDKKVVWELNRHQYLLTLGRAFLRTGNQRYAVAVGEHIASWIRENPAGLGINWLSSLEVAFRSISWLWAIALVRTWKGWSALPLLDIERSLYLHGCHIERYLSTYSSPNTHLTGEALALYYLGTCLPELKHAERWRNLGRSILLDQIELHVRPDGVYFEQSTWYHLYTADFYLHFILLADRAGDPLPHHVQERLTALLDHLMWITRPDGTSPYIGDDDGGKLVKLEDRAFNDWRATLSNGAVMFGRGDYKYVAGEFAEETHWLFGSNARDMFERIPARPPTLTSLAFVDGGFYVMRSGWCPDSSYLLIDCGPHGTMNCGHAHADALSIEVAALGATVLVDPGTFTYTGSAELRDLFRSTAMHNTLTIDGLSSSAPAGPFKWKHVADCTLRCWHDHPSFTFFEGSHDGYERLSDSATHTRAVLFAGREYWLVLDRVDAKDEHEYALHFHIAPNVETVLSTEACRLSAIAGSATLDLVCLEDRGAWRLDEGQVSPCYGARISAPHGIYSVRTKGPPVALLSVLFPRMPDQLPPIIRKLDSKQGKSLSLTTMSHYDLVVWLGADVPEEDFPETDFEWAWMRRALGTRHLEHAVFLHGTRISLLDLEITAEGLLEFVSVSVKEEALSIDLTPRVGVRVRPPPAVGRIVVNGRKHSVVSAEALALSADDVPALTVLRDPTERCKHVRH